MRLDLTAVFRKVPEGYVGFVEELPGANTQGSTLEETRGNLREAVLLVLEANRTLAEKALSSDDVIRGPWPALFTNACCASYPPPDLHSPRLAAEPLSSNCGPLPLGGEGTEVAPSPSERERVG